MYHGLSRVECQRVRDLPLQPSTRQPQDGGPKTPDPHPYALIKWQTFYQNLGSDIRAAIEHTTITGLLNDAQDDTTPPKPDLPQDP